MADRAQYLARTLITRLAQLRANFAEEHRGEPGRGQRIQVIEKVLAVELGITDSATMFLIESAAPQATIGRDAVDREIAGLADFLRQHLRAQLEET